MKKGFMGKQLGIFLIAMMFVGILLASTISSFATDEVSVDRDDFDFNVVVDVLEWGSAATAVVIDYGAVINRDYLATIRNTINVNAIVSNPGGHIAPYFNGSRIIEAVYLSEIKDIEHTLLRRDRVRAAGYQGATTGRYIVVELRYAFNNTPGHVNGSEASRWMPSGGILPAGNRAHWLNLNYSVTIGTRQGRDIGTIRPVYDDFELVSGVGEFAGQRYRLYTPDADGPFPLVVWHHGAGETLGANANANNQGSQLFGNLGGLGWILNSSEDVMVLAPQRLAGGAAAAMGWANYSRAGLVAYIEHLIDTGLVDPNRIYISGASAGAVEAQNHMLENPNLFAAAILICQAGTALNATTAPVIAHIPIWYMQAREFQGAGAHWHNNVSTTSYNAMVAAGAPNVRNTIFTRVFGTEIPNQWYLGTPGNPEFNPQNPNFYNNNHWSWIMALNNVAVNENYTDIFYTTANTEGDRFIDWLLAQSRADFGFDVVVDVLEWGSAVTAVVIDYGTVIDRDYLAGIRDNINVNAIVSNPGGHIAPYFNGSRIIEAVYLSETRDVEHTLLRRDRVRAAGYQGAASGRYIVVELRYAFNNTLGHVNGSEASRWMPSGGILPAGNRAHWLNLEYSVTINNRQGAYIETTRPVYDDFELVSGVGAFDGQRYRLYTPDGSGPFPLVVWHHGAGETLGANANANNQGSQLFGNLGGIGWILNSSEDVMVLAPQRLAGGAAAAMGWANYSRPGLIAYIEHLIETGLVDPNRVYISGASAGAVEAQNHMLENPDFFAAAILICQAGTALNAGTAPVIAHIPIWYMQAREFQGAGAHWHNNVSTTSYNAMVAAGAPNVRNTIFTRVFGTEIPNQWYLGTPGNPEFTPQNPNFYNNNHWSWIMALNNVAVNENYADIFYTTANTEGDRFIDWLLAQSIERLDLEELRAVLAIAEDLTRDNFSAANWRLFSPAFNHALNVYADTNATQADVDNAVNILRNLVNRADLN